MAIISFDLQTIKPVSFLLRIIIFQISFLECLFIGWGLGPEVDQGVRELERVPLKTSGWMVGM